MTVWENCIPHPWRITRNPVSKYFVRLHAKWGKNAKQVGIKVQSEEKIGWGCRGGHAAESSLTWWCYLLRVIYARLKRWWITRALPRLSFVFRVGKCSIEAALGGQPHILEGEKWKRKHTHVHITAVYVLHTHTHTQAHPRPHARQCNFVLTWKPAVLARQRVPFSTCVCLHVCTKEGWRLTGSQGKAWNLWPEYIFSHISDEWGSSSETWQGLFSCLFAGNKYSAPWSRKPGQEII